MKLFLILFFLFTNILGFSQNVFNLARSGSVSEIEEMMKANKEVINKIDENSYSPLILACYHKNKEVAKFLINNVDNIDYISNHGTALSALCINYDKDLVIKLLEKKANPNLQDSVGITPLIWATKLGNVELIKILLEYHADKNLVDNYGKTAFGYAIESKKSEIIDLLKSQ